MVIIIEKQKVTNYWDMRAESYSERIRGDIQSFKKDAWKKIIRDHADSKMADALDIGTGPGFFSIIMAELGFRVTGVDCAEKMLEEAENNLKVAGYTALFKKADCHSLPFEDNSFDLIICRNLVWTLYDPFRAYQEWYRLLRDKGKLLVADANWFLRLSNQMLQKKYELAQEKARQLGYVDDRLSKKQQVECNDIAKKLPLTYQERPRWDKEALRKCGFSNVTIKENIIEDVYDERQKVLHGYVPLFLISGEK